MTDFDDITNSLLVEMWAERMGARVLAELEPAPSEEIASLLASVATLGASQAMLDLTPVVNIQDFLTKLQKDQVSE